MKFRPIKMPGVTATLDPEETQAPAPGPQHLAHQVRGSHAQQSYGPPAAVAEPKQRRSASNPSQNVGHKAADTSVGLLDRDPSEAPLTPPAAPRSERQKPAVKNSNGTKAAKLGKNLVGAITTPGPVRHWTVGTLPPCPNCPEVRVKMSTVKGLKEEILYIFGASFFRCHQCEARYAKFFGRLFHVKESKPITKEQAVFLAISVGAVICLGIALYVQRLAHRWPF
jgi:hypothetical protein